MATEEELRIVRAAKARYERELLENPDVHGIGIGYRRRDGRKTDEVAIVVHVQRKREAKDVSPRNMVPDSVRFHDREGKERVVHVDVVEQPIPVAEVRCGSCSTDLEARERPVPGGYSAGPPSSVSTGGTLGGWIWDNVTEQAVAISNDHVFGGAAGTDITQPSILDGGSNPADRIADVIRSGSLDVSIAAPIDADIAKYEIECGGPGVFEITDATLGMEVQKTGQTTGLTCGLVELIDYNSQHYGSRNDLWIDGDGSDFSKGGDSGSLYLEKTHPGGSNWRRVVGIHWGGSGDDGVGHPIRAVFQDIDATTICAGVVGQLLDALFSRSAGDESEEERELEYVGSRTISWKSDWHREVKDTIVRRIPRPRLRVKSFGRAVEARFSTLGVGRDVVDAIQRNRVVVVSILRHAEGRRAAIALLKPLVGAVTTDDVLRHEMTKHDLENVERLSAVMERVDEDAASDLLKLVRSLVHRARRSKGMTIGALLD